VSATEETRDPDGAAPTGAVGSSAGMSNLDQIMPVALFLVLYNLVGTVWAVVAATAWSVKAAFSRRRRGLPIGAWLPLITAYLVIRAGTTIAVERELIDFGVSAEAVYFGIGFATKMGIGIAIGITIVMGRPMLAWLVPKLIRLDHNVISDPRYLTTMARASWVAAGYEVISSVWDVWLYNNSGVNVFLVTRQVVNFVVAFLVITVTLMYVDRRLDPIEGYPGLVEVLGESGRIRSS
jgi:hypothetical protein